ncbi:ubiquitin carboxyl-terminal hydrolase 36-like [Bradysia coprophila]|uniref:ubiquitin carboxyl-terminal hydrolase 36-like n=1 Tax=Bradysia coprophila TaxID=38358 RepID=UPI00187DB47F|nr:ubiquitin carboxyl-terminal hydrolase 36-like [Bradysia coprophila]
MLKLFNDTRNNVSARSPSLLYNALKRTNRRFSKFLDGKMQDAHEFLELLAEQMETEVHPLKWSEKFFVADIRISVQCSICQNVCETTGILGDLTLDVGHKSIQTALDMYFAWESVNDYDCHCCKKKVAAKKRLSLISSPSCLCITLKRFSENRRKINRKIQIELDLSTTGCFDAASANPRDYKYKLTSIINHVGRNINSGHYTTTVCSADNAFYEFDDTIVRRLNGNGVKESDAYILFYECTKERLIEDDLNQSQREFLYDEHEVHSGNSSPIWNMVDLTKWDGIEVEVLDDSGPISELQEVVLPSIHSPQKGFIANKLVGEERSSIIRKVKFHADEDL